MENNNNLPIQLAKEKSEKAKKRIIKEIDIYLSNNPDETDTSMGEKLHVFHSTFNNWKNGDLKTLPNQKNIEALALLFNVNPKYLSGDSDFRNADNDTIRFNELIEESAIEGLKTLKESLNYYVLSTKSGVETVLIDKDKAFKLIDDRFIDIVSKIIGNVDFWRTLIYEASRLTSLKSIEYYQNNFEQFFNNDSFMPNPTRLEYEDISNTIISKLLVNIFNEYVNEKMIELNIDEKIFEEKERNEQILLLYKDLNKKEK